MTVHTEISVGPTTEEDDELSPTQSSSQLLSAPPRRGRGSDVGFSDYDGERVSANRKDPTRGSIVSISTTISTKSEPMSPQPSSSLFAAGMQHEDTAEEAYQRLGPVPHLRAALVVAQMSSADNFLDSKFTEGCVEIARQNSDFVMGFIALKSLNSSQEDNFLTFTPGVQFADSKKKAGDGLGQQYLSPREVVQQGGTDIIVVGRGILQASDRAAAAQAYRREAWTAYEARIGTKS